MPAPAQPILDLIKREGPATAGRLSARLSISAVAVRKQLARLYRDGLVEFSDHRGGVGRPQRVWSLSETGEARFPDRHACLTTDLLDGISTVFGKAAIEQILAHREAALVQHYRARLRGRTGLAERVIALARLRDAEGYMARAHPRADGALELVQNHCPIRKAAGCCPGLCRSELAVFSAALGRDARVEREEHLLSGDSRCTYLVRPASA